MLSTSSDPRDRIVSPIHKLMIDSYSTPVFSDRYAQVMHLSFVTTPSQSRGRTGDSWANVPCFYFCIAPIVWGNCWELDTPRQTWQCNMKHNRLRGKTAVVLQAGCLHSMWVIVGICWMKVSNKKFCF